jgi:hypothetical protein
MATTEQPTSTTLLQQALAAEEKKSKQLAEANIALVQEFNNAGDYSEQVTIAKDAIKKILPKAIETLQEIIITGEKEAVRANLAKYVVDAVLSGKLDANADAEVANLLRALAENGENIPKQVVASEGAV